MAIKKSTPKQTKIAPRSSEEPKAVKKVVAKSAIKKAEKVEATIPVAKKSESLTVSVYDVKGKETGKMDLPKEVFGAKINPVLMAQAVRVYLTNQRQGRANTKSRGEVDGSTRKVYRQKGTGRARHGGIRAPIYVGGGIAHGPKFKDFELSLSKKMKKASLFSALSQMAKDGRIIVVSGFEKIEPKTKVAASALVGMGLSGQKALVVMPSHLENVFKAARNIAKIKVSTTLLLNTYDVLNGGTLVIMKEAVEGLAGAKKEAKA
ncbi:MAG TPA: 50S ribosomal protein L4 [Patescibacteria group bacterium]